MIRFLAGLWLAVLLAVTPAHAQSFPDHGGKAVVDQAGLLSPQQVADLDAKAKALLGQTGRPFVVATVKSLEGLTVEDYGYRLGRHWGLGGKEEDDGVILLVAPNERKVRIETGYGAEGILPDIVAGRIIRDTIIPRFKEGDMAGGIVAGANAIHEQLRLSPEEVQQQVGQASAERRARDIDINPIPIIFMVIVFFVLIGSIARASGGRRYYGG
ncbi:MAG TPA: TPM domain-containing protein, partial [Sphingomicrobium sp.]|nr:TPM domain-containing protein [Sphingomicrobium sp.]